MDKLTRTEFLHLSKVVMYAADNPDLSNHGIKKGDFHILSGSVNLPITLYDYWVYNEMIWG